MRIARNIWNPMVLLCLGIWSCVAPRSPVPRELRWSQVKSDSADARRLRLHADLAPDAGDGRLFTIRVRGLNTGAEPIRLGYGCEYLVLRFVGRAGTPDHTWSPNRQLHEDGRMATACPSALNYGTALPGAWVRPEWEATSRARDAGLIGLRPGRYSAHAVLRFSWDADPRSGDTVVVIPVAEVEVR